MRARPSSAKAAVPQALSERLKDWFNRYRWTYLLGWVFIAGISLVIKLMGRGLFESLVSIVNFIAPAVPLGLKTALGIALLLFVPMAMGLLGGALLRSLKGRRNIDALRTMQEKLQAEYATGSSEGFPVVLIPWPNPELRSLAVVASRFKETESGRELAAIYLPETPDPTTGALRIVAVDNLTFTAWNLEDLADFHVSFGSVSPSSC